MSITSDQRTLEHRLSEGRIPVSEALHYAMSLAEALRKLHDAGKYHGAVAPTSIVLTGASVELIPSQGPQATITPYTPPEVLQGLPADARSDIFSFGALVFEMLTGRQAFTGEGQTELKLAISNAPPPPSGSPAVDRLVTSCVAKSPAARWQRMQKIIMELKLLSVAARRADTQAAPRPSAETVLRAEIHQLEGRLSARLAEYDKHIAAAQLSAGEAVESVKLQLAELHTQLLALERRPIPPPVDVDALKQQIQGRVDETIAAVTRQIEAQVHETIEAANCHHTAQVQETLDAATSRHTAQVQETLDAAASRHTAQVHETLEAATSRHTAQMQESYGALKEELAARVQEQTDSSHRQHSEHMQESFGALKQEVAAQVKDQLDSTHRDHSAQLSETVAAATHSIDRQAKETVAAANDRIAATEHSMDEVRKHFATLQENVAGDLHDFEKTLKSQGVAIESARTAMAQTDDLVERVVEALELLQSSMIDQHEVSSVN